MIYQNRSDYHQVRNAFIALSILLHLLLFYALIIVLPLHKNKKIIPHHYLPAYTYNSSVLPKRYAPAREYPRSRMQKPIRVKSQNAITLKPQSNPARISGRKSIMASTLEVLQNDLITQAAQRKEAEPIYLIGDLNQSATGIILLLAKALSAHFSYPRTAGELGVKGRVIVAVTLHPDGHFSDIEMLKSSESQELDSAALYAVNSAPLVDGANRFLEKPRRFVVGYIFQQL